MAHFVKKGLLLLAQMFKKSIQDTGDKFCIADGYHLKGY
jgi:hypothetical protein